MNVFFNGFSYKPCTHHIYDHCAPLMQEEGQDCNNRTHGEKLLNDSGWGAQVVWIILKGNVRYFIC